MNAQQLRNSILQEAIEGRLVPQDPNDEPASVLLERIREEKKHLVKEGKLKKKDLEETPISEDEKPFEIPESWEWVRLGSLISYQNGYAYNSSEMNKEGKGAPVIKSGNLMTLEVVIKPNNDYIEYPTEKMLSSKIVKGDMLMCLSSQSDNPEPLGKTAIFKFDSYALLNQRVLKIRPYKDELTPYLYYTINSFYFWFNVSHQGGGSAQANLKLNHVLDMPIPLPPLAEQKCIVAKIEELLPKVEEYGKAQDALNKLNEELPEKLKKSVLQEAIEGRLVPQDPNDEPASVLLNRIREEKKQLVKEGKLKKKDLEETPISEDEKPFDIPESWEWVRLAEVSSYRRGSFPQPYTDLTSYGGPNSMPFVQVADVEEYTYKLKEQTKKTISQKAIPFSVFAPKGTVVVTLQGSIGKVAITQYDSYVDRTLAIFNHIYGKINKMFFSIVLKNKFENEALYARGATIKTITKEEFQSFVLPLPPLAEQKRIVAKIEEVFAEIDKLK